MSTARRKYRTFIQNGIAEGKRDDLVGGGLIRSAGGWTAVKTLRRINAFQKGDERILGDGDFVQSVLSEAKEALERKYKLAAKGIGIDDIARKAAEIFGIDPGLIWIKSKQSKIVQARSLLCYWATDDLGFSQSDLSKRLGLTPSAVSIAVVRGKELVRKCGFKLDEFVKSRDIVVFSLNHEEHEEHEAEITMKFFLFFMIFMVKFRLFTKPSSLETEELTYLKPSLMAFKANDRR